MKLSGETKVLGLALLFFTISFCTGFGVRYLTHSCSTPTYSILKPKVSKSVTIKGKASYYGAAFDGKTTASGDKYDMNQYTCASPKLPFGTILLVTNTDNNKSIIVMVNDRGPFKMNNKGKPLYPLKPHPTRLLDLSKKAFSEISDIEKGVINIKYEILKYDR